MKSIYEMLDKLRKMNVDGLINKIVLVKFRQKNTYRQEKKDMFGYIRYSKPDLTFREFYIYRTYYCGVCKWIKKNFGELPRVTLNYDIVFISILLSAIYLEEDKYSLERCAISGFKKKKLACNEYIDYATYVNIMLVYHKLLDNYLDDKSIQALFASKLLRKNYQKVVDKYTYKAEVLQDGLSRMQALEKNKLATLENMSNIFGEIFGELFVYKDDEHAEILRKLGYSIGRYVYILDSYEDLEDDIRKKRYNPLTSYDKDNISSIVEREIELLLSEIEIMAKDLKLRRLEGLVCNVLVLGLRNKANMVMKRRIE
ncbi:MAG TPA: hypothetical protein DEG71_09235 [Clostridiales bacterium]|nr:hypothetical protein [Clostridiales bacterium]